MRASVIQHGEGAGARRATVERLCGGIGEWASWAATHECGWWEQLAYWHSAFWAADHHMRYDCGRREPSSGGYSGVSGVCPACNGSGTDLGRRGAPLMCGTCAGTGGTHWDMTPVPVDFTAHGVGYAVPMGTAEYERNRAEHETTVAHLRQAGASSGDVALTVHEQVEHRRMSDEEYRDRLADAQAMDLYLKSTGPLFDQYLGEALNLPAPTGYDTEPCWDAYEQDVHRGHIYKDPITEAKTWCPGPAANWRQYVDEVRQGIRAANEGGVQKDPTPTPTEDPTVELGAITAELGPVPGPLVGMQWEGSTGDDGVGSAGWWARVRGKGHAG